MPSRHHLSRKLQRAAAAKDSVAAAYRRRKAKAKRLEKQEQA